MTAGKGRGIVVEYARQAASPVGGVRVGVAPVPDDDRLIAEAVAAAGSADATVVVVGLTDEWEGEGFDRPSYSLPGRQDELIALVAAANPRTVVVVNAGTPVAMPWADSVAAVVQPWYGGQEHGPALAAVLLGDAEPGGRLPLTVPRALEDTPAHRFYPGVGGRALYGEQLLMGYRWYERTGIEPRFPFGHGLGYTRWEWGHLEMRPSGSDAAVVTVELRNTGDRPGSEVVQVYRRWPTEHDHRRPARELVGFARVRAEPGGVAVATVHLDERALRRWEDGGWTVPAGTALIEVGASCADVRSAAEWRR